jgi:TP901 family phage tail tape measure protein
MIGGALQRITVEVGGKIAASLGRALRDTQRQVSTFGRNVNRTMNDAAIAGKKGFKNIFDNALWQQAAVGAASIGFALAGSVKVAASFENVLSDIGKTSGASAAELKILSNQLLALSGRGSTNIGPQKLAEGVQDLVAQGLELKDAVASMEALGRVATATNSDLLDVTKTGFQLQNALKIRPTELKATFDALAFAGKQGAFELKDMAQFMPTIAAAAKDLGITGKKGAIELAAMMQMVRKNAPDSGQAATRLTDALMKMTAPDAVKNFKKFGVNIKQVMADARKKGINPMEAAVTELQRVTKGDIFELSKIFGDKEAKLALMSLMKYRKEYEQLKANAGGKAAAGTVDKDYERSLKTFQGTLSSFQNSTQRLGIAVGNSLLPPLTRLAELITPLVERFANFAATNPRLATGIVLVGGALAGLTLALPVIAGVVQAFIFLRKTIMAVNIGGLIAGWLPVILSPVGLIVAAIAGIAVAAFLIIKNWKTIGPFFANLWQNVIGFTKRVGPQILAFMFPIPAMIIRLFRGSGIGQNIITSIIDGLKAKFGALVGWIRGAWSNISGMFGGGGGAPAAAPQPPGRASGGPVRAGHPYIVGERRRELFVPGMDGAIIPRVARPAGGGGGVTINAPVTINAAGGDAMAIRDQVRMAFEDLIARAYGDYRVALND